MGEVEGGGEGVGETEGERGAVQEGSPDCEEGVVV